MATPEIFIRAGEKICGRYEARRKMGQGEFGEVWSGVDLQSGKNIAIKRTRRIFNGVLRAPSDAIKTIREIHILRKMQEGRRDDDNPGPHHVCSLVIISVSYHSLV